MNRHNLAPIAPRTTALPDLPNFPALLAHNPKPDTVFQNSAHRRQTGQLRLRTEGECQTEWQTVEYQFEGLHGIRLFEDFQVLFWRDLKSNVLIKWGPKGEAVAWHLLWEKLKERFESFPTRNFENRDSFLLAFKLNVGQGLSNADTAEMLAKIVVKYIEPLQPPFAKVFAVLNLMALAVDAKVRLSYALTQQDRARLWSEFERFKNLTAVYLVCEWHYGGDGQEFALREWVNHFIDSIPHNLSYTQALITPERVRQEVNHLLEPQYRIKRDIPHGDNISQSITPLRDVFRSVSGGPAPSIERNVGSSLLSHRLRRVYGFI